MINSFRPHLRVLLPAFLAAIVLIAGHASPGAAAGTAVLTGKVMDIEGRPVEGARLFLYDTPEVRRSASFISAPTGPDGTYRLIVTPGRYWSMARLKKMDGYGPLMAGDKHSGDPAEIELAEGQEMSRDFTVADLKDARRMRSKDREGPVTISGRIVDQKGLPVRGAYAIANRTEKTGGLPDYVSAWSDADGRYSLSLPPGRYYLGSALSFPPDERAVFLKGQVAIDAGRSDLDIPRSPGEPPVK